MNLAVLRICVCSTARTSSFEMRVVLPATWDGAELMLYFIQAGGPSNKSRYFNYRRYFQIVVPICRDVSGLATALSVKIDAEPGIRLS